MVSAYPACFFKEETGYTVVFPDLNWLSTCGETLEEALAMAIDCLAGYLYTCEKEDIVFPSPSQMEKVNLEGIAEQLEISVKESFINIVSVNVAEYAKEHFEKSVKKTLTIPAWLNQAALDKGINFSQVLQEALKEKVLSSNTNTSKV